LQIAIALAVCELLFIALLNEIVEFSAGWSLHIQNSVPEKSGCVHGWDGAESFVAIKVILQQRV
jgi:hypothetical protein